MDEVQDHVVGSGVPVRLGGLLGPQLLESGLQAVAELVGQDRVGLDGGAVADVEGEDEARLFEMGGLAPQFGNALLLEIGRASVISRE